MSEKDRMILWSSGFEVPDGNMINLPLQLSYTLARLVGYAMEALPPSGPRLARDLLRRISTAALSLARAKATYSSQAIPLFAAVTEKAPKFEPVWAKLLLVETEQYIAVPADQVEQVAAQLRKHIIQARPIKPDLLTHSSPRSELALGDDFTQRALLLERALSIDPNNVYALSARAVFTQQF